MITIRGETINPATQFTVEVPEDEGTLKPIASTTSIVANQEQWTIGSVANILGASLQLEEGDALYLAHMLHRVQNGSHAEHDASSREISRQVNEHLGEGSFVRGVRILTSMVRAGVFRIAEERGVSAFDRALQAHLATTASQTDHDG